MEKPYHNPIKHVSFRLELSKWTRFKIWYFKTFRKKAWEKRNKNIAKSIEETTIKKLFGDGDAIQQYGDSTSF